MRLKKWAIITLLLLQQKVGDHVFFVSQHLASILSYHSHQGPSSNPDTPNTFKDSFERHHLYSILADIHTSGSVHQYQKGHLNWRWQYHIVKTNDLLYIQTKMPTTLFSKHCQRQNGPMALSTSTHSMTLAQSESFNKL